VGIGACVAFAVLFVGGGVILTVSAIREGNRVMKMKPEELFPPDLVIYNDPASRLFDKNRGCSQNLKPTSEN
jgi:hypothetical protein